MILNIRPISGLPSGPEEAFVYDLMRSISSRRSAARTYVRAGSWPRCPRIRSTPEKDAAAANRDALMRRAVGRFERP